MKELEAVLKSANIHSKAVMSDNPSAILKAAQTLLQLAKGECEWVIVPKEPTQEMTASARVQPAGDRCNAIRTYQAMLSAAPKFELE